jgi:hypothetical protein
MKLLLATITKHLALFFSTIMAAMIIIGATSCESCANPVFQASADSTSEPARAIALGLASNALEISGDQKAIITVTNTGTGTIKPSELNVKRR